MGEEVGLHFFILDSIQFKLRTDIIQTEEEKSCEYLFIDFEDSDSKSTVGVIYKKKLVVIVIPSLNFINKMLENVLLSTHHLV